MKKEDSKVEKRRSNEQHRCRMFSEREPESCVIKALHSFSLSRRVVSSPTRLNFPSVILMTENIRILPRYFGFFFISPAPSLPPSFSPAVFTRQVKISFFSYCSAIFRAQYREKISGSSGRCVETDRKGHRSREGVACSEDEMHGSELVQ